MAACGLAARTPGTRGRPSFAEPKNPRERQQKIPSREGCRVSGGVGAGTLAGRGQPTPAFGHPSKEGREMLCPWPGARQTRVSAPPSGQAGREATVRRSAKPWGWLAGLSLGLRLALGGLPAHAQPPALFSAVEADPTAHAATLTAEADPTSPTILRQRLVALDSALLATTRTTGQAQAAEATPPTPVPESVCRYRLPRHNHPGRSHPQWRLCPGRPPRQPPPQHLYPGRQW